MEILGRRFNFTDTRIEFRPRYNVAPTQEVLTVTHNSDNAAQFMRWAWFHSGPRT